MPDLIPTSPADGTHIAESFLTNDAVTDAALGQLRWERVTIANASTPSYLTATGHGALRLTTAATADGDGEALRLFTDALVLEGKGGWFRTRVRYPDITGNQLAGNNFRIGLDDSVTATSPTVGIWIDSDAGVLSLQVDSADGGDKADAASGVSTLTSGTTMVLGTWHDIEVHWEGENALGGPENVRMYVDGELAAEVKSTLIDNDEEVEIKIAHWQDSGGAADLELDIDYFEAWLPR